MKSSDTPQPEKLPSDIYQIEKRLERLRQEAYKKTKGLFKRTLLKSWVILTASFISLSIGLSESQEIGPGQIVGPILISLILSLIVSGIYWLIQKTKINTNFMTLLKKDLVGEIAESINRDMVLNANELTQEDYDNANLFNGEFHVDDTIETSINGVKATASESWAKSVSHKSHFLFRGLFIKMELKNINVSSPLKIFPEQSEISLKNIQRLLSEYHPLKDNSDKMSTHQLADGTAIDAYCPTKSEGERILLPEFLQVITSLFNTYGPRNLFISLHKNAMYLALVRDFNQDMFEMDFLLKQNLVESGIADQFHKDLLFIDQLTKDMNKINNT